MKNNVSYEDILELLRQFQEEKSMTDYIRPSLLPDIALYMDQVTTFMDEHLKSTKRYADDKILTKTMINNYAKNNLLPPPEKKKYSKDHLLLLAFIYYYKNFLSINDIQTLLAPVTEKYFNSSGSVSLEDIYASIFNTQMSQIDDIFTDIENKYRESGKAFTDCPEDDRDLLSLFSFMCSLSYDIYLKKQVVERIIDLMNVREKARQDEKDKEAQEKKAQEKKTHEKQDKKRQKS